MPEWFLNRALTNFRNEVNERWPNRDKTSDGTIGDIRHQATSSAHNPDPDGSVDAWDMDNDGVDINACKKAFEAHPASKYWIYNDIISFRSEGWRERSYAYAGPGRSRHTEHVHWETRDGYDNNNLPWFKGVNIAIADSDANKIAGAVWGATFGPEIAGTKLTQIDTRVESIENAVIGIQEAIVKMGTISSDNGTLVNIPDDQLERVLRKVLGSLDN